MTAAAIVCPLCQSADLEILANIPAILLCKCRSCATAFTITPTVPTAPDADASPRDTVEPSSR